jgi:foldase protein PrsA
MKKPRFRSIAFAAVLGALTLALVGCGGSDSKSSDDVPDDAVALVGEQEISKTQFDALIAQARASAKQQKRTFPKAGTPEFKNLQNQGLEYLIRRAEFEQKADDMDVEVTDKQVDERLEQLKKQFYGGDDKKFKSSLKKLLLTEDQVRKDVRAQLLEEQLYKKVTEDVKVTDKEIEDFYKKNKSQYEQAATREVRHILVKTKAEADRIYDQLKGGADFAAIAKQKSLDPGSKSNGGKLTVSRGQTVAPFDQSAFLLPTRSLSRPIKTEFGYHLIQPLGEVKPAKTTPLAQVKGTIKSQLEQERKQKALSTWSDEIKKEYEDKVEYAAAYEPPAAATETSTTTATP